MKFSIVVAAYNVASYIGQCLESLINQTYRNFEVIVINDASTDNTLDEIYHAIGDDSRFSVVTMPINSGSHLVRKFGAAHASGDWVLFVDGDDDLKNDALQFLSESLHDTSADIAYFGRDVIPQAKEDAADANVLEQGFNRNFGSLSGNEIIEAAFSDNENRILWTVISIVVKREVVVAAFDKMTDSRMGRMQDAYEFLALCSQSKECISLGKHLLNYEWGRGVTGSSHQNLDKFTQNVKDILQVLQESAKFANQYGGKICKQAVQWMALQLPQHISTELILRVNITLRQEAFLRFARIWGTDIAVGELNRLILEYAERERLSNGRDDSELVQLMDIRGFLCMERFPNPSNLSVDNRHLDLLQSSADKSIELLKDQLMKTNDTVSAVDKTIEQDSDNRLAIFCFYDKRGHAASFIRYFLDDLMKNIRELVVVVNGSLDDESRKLFLQYTNTVLVRENVGLDVAAYKMALLHIGWEKLRNFDEVICLNDTVLGPVYPFREMFREMSSRPIDFWGITAYAGETVGDEEIPTHLQAYWHVYRRSLVTSEAFHRYWEDMPLWKSYAEVTRKHEMQFTKHFADLGFTWDSYVNWRKYAGISSYPLLYMPETLLKDDRCPVFKRRSFFVPYEFTFDQTAGQPAMDLYDFLSEHTTYDVNYIWDAILPSYNIDDIRRAMHLDYVLPIKANNPEPDIRLKASFIFHIFFLDLLDNTMHYIAQLPDDVDLYITSTEDKFECIRQKFDEYGIKRKPVFISVQNRGRDVSALLVAARDVVLGGKYDIIGFAHDKKSSQNQEAGHHGTETQGFAYKLMENTLGSRTYVRNILRLFASNPRLGLVCPPPPYHALYFAHTLPVDWGPNFPATRELLEDCLNVHVPLDSSKPTVSAIGSCYWFRVAALKPLFEAGWTYEDFLPEGQMGGDGSISHAIERANGYVVQSQGYYPAWVMSDRYARLEVDSLFHATSTLLREMGPFRQGETLLQTANSLGQQLSHNGRVKRFVRRKAHLGLKWFTRYFVQPLPEPVTNVLYRVAWWPVNAYRNTRNALGKAIKGRK